MGELISYDGVEVFEDQPDPLVSKATEYLQAGNRWGTLERISLNGVITGSSFTNIYETQMGIISKFGEDFKTLSIDGFGDFYQCRLGTINFDDSDYFSNVSYSIDLESYDIGDNNLLAAHGVINPVNSISYSENDDQSVAATRTISAQGVSVGPSSATPDRSDAVQNAREFVGSYAGQSRAGDSDPSKSNWVLPPFFAGMPYKDSNAPMLLISQSETFDRFTAQVSLTEEYVIDATGDPTYSANYLLRYSEDSNSSEEAQEHINVNGSIEGSKHSTDGIGGAFAYYKNFKKTIDEVIYNESITQDVKNSSLNFSFEYDRGYNLDIIPQISISINEGSDSSLISVSLNGSVRPKRPNLVTDEEIDAECGNCEDCWAAAYPAVLKFFEENTPEQGVEDSDTTLWYNHAQKAYEDYLALHPTVPAVIGGDSVLDEKLRLNPVPSSSSVTHDRANAVISFSYTYSDAFSALGAKYDEPTTIDPRYSLDVSLSASPMVEQIATTEGINGYLNFDQGYHSLASLNLNIDVVGRPLTAKEDLSIVGIAQLFSTPWTNLTKELTPTQALTHLSQNRNYGTEPLNRKSYSMSWEFKSKVKLTDHPDNKGNGGFYVEGISKLHV